MAPEYQPWALPETSEFVRNGFMAPDLYHGLQQGWMFPVVFLLALLTIRWAFVAVVKVLDPDVQSGPRIRFLLFTVLACLAFIKFPLLAFGFAWETALLVPLAIVVRIGAGFAQRLTRRTKSDRREMARVDRELDGLNRDLRELQVMAIQRGLRVDLDEEEADDYRPGILSQRVPGSWFTVILVYCAGAFFIVQHGQIREAAEQVHQQQMMHKREANRPAQPKTVWPSPGELWLGNSEHSPGAETAPKLPPPWPLEPGGVNYKPESEPVRPVLRDPTPLNPALNPGGTDYQHGGG